MLQKMLTKKILSSVFEDSKIKKKFLKDFQITKMLKYVNEENDADLRINELEIEVAKLKRLSHPPIFTEGERDEILKRLTRIENYLKRR